MTTNYPDAPDNSAQSLTPSEVIPLLIGSTVEEVPRALVVQTLAHAAQVLGLWVRTLRNKIRLYAPEGVEVPAHREGPDFSV
jgi:hypothetical protein